MVKQTSWQLRNNCVGCFATYLQFITEYHHTSTVHIQWSPSIVCKLLSLYILKFIFPFYHNADTICSALTHFPFHGNHVCPMLSGFRFSYARQAVLQGKHTMTLQKICFRREVADMMAIKTGGNKTNTSNKAPMSPNFFTHTPVRNI